MPPRNQENLQNNSTVEQNFKVKVATRKVESPESLPTEVLRFVIKNITKEVSANAITQELHDFFVSNKVEDKTMIGLEIIDTLDKEKLLQLLQLLRACYQIDELLQINYPILYQVFGKDENAPIVSFFSFSDEIMDKHISTAWVAAGTSRSDEKYEVMFDQVLNMVAGNQSAAADKIEKFGINYGHSSILGLVPIFIFINNIPIESAYLIHHLIETYSSQELSTRYVELENLYIRPVQEMLDLSQIPEESNEDREFIINEWKAIQEHAIGNYKKWYKIIWDAYFDQFGEFAGDKKIAKSTYVARVLDIARNWIPLGAPTSMAVLFNLITAIGLIRMLKESGEQELMDLAEQIEFALKVTDTQEGKQANARIAPLLKHAEAQNVVKNNVRQLKIYLKRFKGFKEMLAESKERPNNYNRETNVTKIDNTDNITIMVVQYIRTAFPSLKTPQILEWLSSLDDDQLARIGGKIYKDHFRHQPMTNNMGNIKADSVLEVEMPISGARDWGRQRSAGKADVGYLLPVIHNIEPTDYEDILNQGFNTTVQLMETTGLQQYVEEWKNDANTYYNRLHEYYQFIQKRYPNLSLDFIRKLIPLGHQTTFHISMPLTQRQYIEDLRSTTGNDLSNRYIAEQMSTDTRSSSPFLRDVRTKSQEEPLDFNSPKQFAERV